MKYHVFPRLMRIGLSLLVGVGILFGMSSSAIPRALASAHIPRQQTQPFAKQDQPTLPTCQGAVCNGLDPVTTRCQGDVDQITPIIDTIDTQRQELALWQSVLCPQVYYATITKASVEDAWQRAATFAAGQQEVYLEMTIQAGPVNPVTHVSPWEYVTYVHRQPQQTSSALIFDDLLSSTAICVQIEALFSGSDVVTDRICTNGPSSEQVVDPSRTSHGW